MQFKKLVECINKLKPEYYMLVQCVINHVLQEIIDSESFYDNGPQDISTQELLDTITSKTNEQTAQMILTCVVEFCITNYYPYEGQSWNFIDYYLTHHKDRLTTKEQKYLAALNKSYMSIYKITSVSPNNFVVMEDQVESKTLKLKVFDKYFSQKIQKGQHVAVRALLKPNKKNKLKEYEISSSVLIIGPGILDHAISVIRNITNPMLSALEGNSDSLPMNWETITDTDHNRLLIKKMWTKEILEHVYEYNSNFSNYHTVLDYDGNPWCPCIIEFDLLTTAAKIKNALFSIEELKYDQSNKGGNVWLWLSTKYNKFNAKNIKLKLPNITDDLEKPPIFNGAFITNDYDNQGYHIYAEIKLDKTRLLVEVNSRQRGNIVQDRLLQELHGMIANPVTHLQNL